MLLKHFLSESFRPMFWLGALFSSIAIPLWIISFLKGVDFQFYGSMLFWHAHEMLFGFASIMIVGFLNTAVKNWTGKLSYGPSILFLLIVFWLVARILFIFPIVSAEVLRWIDLSFLLFSTLFFFKNLLSEENYGHMFYVPLFLLLLIFLNYMMHTALMNHHLHLIPQIAFATVMLIGHLILTVSGRTLPLFTANATRTKKVLPIQGMEIFIHINFFTILAMQMGYLQALHGIQGMIILLYVALNLFKSLRLKPWITYKLPLLWTLHFSAYCIILGFLLMGLFEFDLIDNRSFIIHAITVGGIGLMGLSMMSRVSLGHTGRPIEAHALITLSLIALILAFLFRVVLPSFFISHYSHLLVLAATFWSMAFLFYFIGFTPKLFQERHYSFVLPVEKIVRK